MITVSFRSELSVERALNATTILMFRIFSPDDLHLNIFRDFKGRKLQHGNRIITNGRFNRHHGSSIIMSTISFCLHHYYLSFSRIRFFINLKPVYIAFRLPVRQSKRSFHLNDNSRSTPVQTLLQSGSFNFKFRI